MKRPLLLLAVIVGLIAASLVAIAVRPAVLGLDLQGGVEVILQGPAVGGCGSPSGGSEVVATFNTTAQGAAQVYPVSLATFALSFACSGEATVAEVLANLAQVNILLKNTNIQYVNKDPDGVAFTNGLNVGSIKFN